MDGGTFAAQRPDHLTVWIVFDPRGYIANTFANEAPAADLAQRIGGTYWPQWKPRKDSHD